MFSLLIILNYLCLSPHGPKKTTGVPLVPTPSQALLQPLNLGTKHRNHPHPCPCSQGNGPRAGGRSLEAVKVTRDFSLWNWASECCNKTKSSSLVGNLLGN